MTRALVELDDLIAAGWGDIPQVFIPDNWEEERPPRGVDLARLLADPKFAYNRAMMEVALDEVLAYYDLPGLTILMQRLKIREEKKNAISSNGSDGIVPPASGGGRESTERRMR